MKLCVIVPIAVAPFLATMAVAQARPVRIRGEIVAVKGDHLTIKTRAGRTIKLDLAKGYAVGTVAKASLADIKPNDYVGTAAIPQSNGMLKALEVHIFPPAKRGVGEGFHAWDLAPHSSMTNAPVTGIVKSAHGSVLTLTYHGGRKKVLVSPGTPIVRDEKGSPADVKPGVGVLAFAAKKTGSDDYAAGRIVVGQDGVNPPQ